VNALLDKIEQKKIKGENGAKLGGALTASATLAQPPAASRWCMALSRSVPQTGPLHSSARWSRV
jgi:hypothetical protein